MKLTIEGGALFLNNRHFCWVEPGNGRTNLESGRSEVFTKFSPAHGAVLAYAPAYGWIGADASCDIVLGRVRHSTGLLPHVDDIDRLVRELEQHEFGDGESCILRIKSDQQGTHCEA